MTDLVVAFQSKELLVESSGCSVKNLSSCW